MKKNILTIIVLIIVTSHSIFGNKDSNLSNVNILPPSPTASALGEYIDFPVSHYTGIPQIQIPLYTIKQKNVSIPISLSYHAKGIKVEDIASWVGLGWSLNAGGLITRSVQGLPDDGFHFKKEYINESTDTYNVIKDEYRKGQFDTDETVDDISNTSFIGVLEEERDLQPDYFYVNCLNLNFKFVFDRDENIYLIPQSDIRITKETDSDGLIVAFTITDASGVEYYFNKVEESKTLVSWPTWYYQTVMDRTRRYEYTKTYNSTWLLGSITDVHGNVITFEYDDEEITYAQRGNRKSYHYCEYSTMIWRTEFNEIYHTVNTKKLRTITWDGGKVSFTRGLNRQDLQGAKALTDISVYNLSNELIKGYSLNHSHFVTDGSTDIYGKRLKLESVQEYSINSTVPAYTFTYNRTVLPSRLGFNLDFWGYYNSNVSQLTTKTYYYPDHFDEKLRSQHFIFPLNNYTGEEEIFGDADRNSNDDDILACILERVEYPTGGYSQFNYELHEFQNPDNLFSLDKNISGGGIRVESIIYSEDGSNSIEKKYHYELSTDPTTTSGKLTHLPQYAKNWTIGYGCDVEYPTQISIETHSLSGLGTTHGSHVGYTEVKEEIPGNGYTLYKYTMPGSFEVDEDLYVGGTPIYNRSEMKEYHNSTISEIDISHPYPPNSNLDWYRGLLEEVTVYDNLSNPLHKIENKYEIKSVEKISAIYTQKKSKITSSSETLWWFFFAEYDIISPWVVQSSVTEYNYDPQDHLKFITNTRDYSYESVYHKNVTKITESHSDGSNQVIRNKYPPDYVLLNSNSCTDERDNCMSDAETEYNDCMDDDNSVEEVCANQRMVNEGACRITYDRCSSLHASAEYQLLERNMISTPIETQYLLNKGGTDYLIGGTLKKYAEFDGILKPRAIYSIKTNRPMTDLTQSALSGTGYLTYHSAYGTQPELVFSYDNNGNLSDKRKESDVPGAYIWGYNGARVIAEAINAESDEIIYENFEEDSYWLPHISRSRQKYTGEWGAGIFGNGERQITMVGSYVWAGNTTEKKFKYSAYVYSLADLVWLGVSDNFGNLADYKICPKRGEWVLLEGECTVPSDATSWGVVMGNENGDGVVYVDDVRMYPADAQMTTYTHDPLVGITSETDIRNRTTTYEYDDLGRLLRVRDNEGHILKEHKYNYAGQ